MIKLVAALGNPGHEYAFTRHNIAWLLLEYLSCFPDMKWKKKFKGSYSDIKIGEKTFLFLKPETYMNRSGTSVVETAAFYRVEPQDILVIHDDIEMNFGTIGFKDGGGLAGHNGLRSVSSALSTRNFKRLRLGISKPNHLDITSHVLSSFSPCEQNLLPGVLQKTAGLLEQCLESDFSIFQKKHHKQNLLVSPD